MRHRSNREQEEYPKVGSGGRKTAGAEGEGRGMSSLALSMGLKRGANTEKRWELVFTIDYGD